MPHTKKIKSLKPNKGDKEEYNSFLRFSSIGVEMFGMIALGVWGGYQLDAYFETSTPILTIVGSLLSIVGSIVYIIIKLPKE